MPRIFISHASQDSAAALAVRGWLADKGWDDVFLDLDPRRGLVAGEHWQQALSRAAHRCEAVVILLSPDWAASKWCLAEFLLAKSLGKAILASVVRTAEFSELPRELTMDFQLARLVPAGADDAVAFAVRVPGEASPHTVALSQAGLDALALGLEKASPRPDWFALQPGRPVYPGLDPLDTDDAAVFFGRDADILRCLDRLRRARDGTVRMLLLLGASGAGKSSFLRAGLWPRLRRLDREFLVLPVLRPGNAPISGPHGLLQTLHQAAGAEGLQLGHERAYWRQQLEKAGPGAVAGELVAAARQRLGVGAAVAPSAPQLLLPIDQAEELLRPGAEAAQLLDWIVAGASEGSLLVVLALRSDTFPAWQRCAALKSLDQASYSLRAVHEGHLAEIIEGPARRRSSSGKPLLLDPELTARLLQHWPRTDTLPLLAFTLRRLLDDYGSGGTITLSAYEALGGLEGALKTVTDGVLDQVCGSESTPAALAAREQLLRETFIPRLTALDPQTREPLRRLAAAAELMPEDAGPADQRAKLVRALIEARLLSTDEGTVEVAHEAVLQRWPLLRRVIDREREMLVVLDTVRRDAQDWQAGERRGDLLLHRGARLAEAEARLGQRDPAAARRRDLDMALGQEGRDYLAACRLAEETSAREAAQQARREAGARTLVRRLVYAGLAVVLLAAVVLSGFARNLEQRRSELLAALAAQAYEQGRYGKAVRYAVAAADQRASWFGFDASAGERELIRASQRLAVRAVVPASFGVALSEGRFATAESDEITLHMKFGEPSRRISCDEGSYVTALETAAQGRLLFARSGDLVCVIDTATSDVTRIPLPVNVWQLRISDDGSRLAAADTNEVHVRDIRSGQTWSFVHDKPVRSIALSGNGQLLAASLDQQQKIALVELNENPTFSQVEPDARDGNIDLNTAGTQLLTREARLFFPRRNTGLAVLPSSVYFRDKRIDAAFFAGRSDLAVALFDEDAEAWLLDADGNRRQLQTGYGYATPASPLRSMIAGATLVFADTGEHAAASTRESTILSWHLPVSGVRVEYSMPVEYRGPSEVGSLHLSATGDLLVATGYAEGDNDSPLVYAMDVGALHARRNWHAAQQPISHVVMHPQGDRVAVADEGATIRIWRLTDARPAYELSHPGTLRGLAYNRTGSVLASATDDEVRLWSDSGQPIASVRSPEALSEFAVAPDGPRGALLLSDRILIWSPPEPLQPLPLPDKQRVRRILFGATDDDLLVVSDEAVTRWNVRTKALLESLRHDNAAFVGLSSRSGLWASATPPVVGLAPERVVSLFPDIDSPRNALWAKGTDLMRVTQRLPVGVRFFDGRARELGRLPSFPDLPPDEGAEYLSQRVFGPAALSASGEYLVLAEHGQLSVWDTRLLMALKGEALITHVCSELLYPSERGLEDTASSLLSDDELTAAPVLDAALDTDVCRPAGSWQRLGQYVSRLFGQQ